MSIQPELLFHQCNNRMPTNDLLGKGGGDKKLLGDMYYILSGIYANCYRIVLIYPVDQILFTCTA